MRKPTGKSRRRSRNKFNNKIVAHCVQQRISTLEYDPYLHDGNGGEELHGR